MDSSARGSRIGTLVALVVAGEAIFGLPFHVARFFRPTVLAVLRVSNAELGGFFSAYGVLAMLSYVPGGILADRFSARALLAVSLASTAAGGLYFASVPGHRGLMLLFAFFGVTTILTFWGALISAMRQWGGARHQGAAFGVLDGGRGAVAAILASLALLPLRATLGANPTAAIDAERALALQRIILLYTGATFAAAAFVWFAVPDGHVHRASEARPAWRDVREVLGDPKTWLQASIVVCAYCAYKGLDNFGLFAVVAYGMDEIAGARVSVLGAWLRPVAALGAGLLADRITPSRAALICFFLLVCGFISFIVTTPGPSTMGLLWLNVAVTAACVFGLRGVYFALLEESDVPVRATGTAVGVVSFVGFTPDVFIAPLTGWLLDRSPGPAGHKHVFALLGAIASIGVFASLLLSRFTGAKRSATSSR